MVRVREELTARLNNNGYKNWLKAGRCLLILKDALHPYTDDQMKVFHKDLLLQNSLLVKPCRTFCTPKGNQLCSPCMVCSEWQKVILSNHRQPHANINWSNCVPSLWQTKHWEVAKAFMPRGQNKVSGAAQCDASALLNLINNCVHFNRVNQTLVKQVIQCRNELMHSGDFSLTDDWMKRFWTTLMQFVNQFNRVPQMETVGVKLEKMLTTDFSITVCGMDQMDSTEMSPGLEPDSVSQSEASAELISQWEAELLQEMLQECRPASDDDEDAKTQDAEQLKKLEVFIQANKDLEEKFKTQLQAINSPE